MNDSTAELRATTAAKYGLSVSGAEVLFRALVAGGGSQAQFSHPDLGGMGQWSNGMTQVGDMFNDALKAKVGGFCHDMAAVARAARHDAGAAHGRWQGEPACASGVAQRGSPMSAPATWWPADLGWPASSGAQNGMRYACFPDRRRLAIERDGQAILYDTGPHRLNGFSQQQSGTSSIAFSGQNGPVAIESLTVVER